jgi:hypothetical protein
LIESHNAFGIPEWERPQKNAIHDTEHGSIRADADCESSYDSSGKQRALPQHTYREAQVLKYRAEPAIAGRRYPGVATLFEAAPQDVLPFSE